MILTNPWSDKLLKLPETGMGYHIVTITLKDGTVYKNVTIYSGEYVVGNGFDCVDIADIQVT